MIKIPYGISNFEVMIQEGYSYIDRTQYIERLEQSSLRYLFFVRPRRFGKSLFLSTLEYYYGVQHKEKFDTLFGQYYIGQHPSKSANKHLVLKFDFSQMDTTSFENTYSSFLNNVKLGAVNFLEQYPRFFSQEQIERVSIFGFTYLQNLSNLKAYVVVFVGNEGRFLEI